MENAKRVAVNTIIQYIRLILSVLIGLYTVRVILYALGKSDYGVYDVVGGVITVLSFIRGSLTQTSIRFLSVSLGKNDKQHTRNTFNNCFWLHFVLAFLFFIILEIAGLFLFDGILNIAENRIDAAKWVYHCMTFSMFMDITITPFMALIIAHEKFIYTAFITILDSLLKLSIAFIIKNVLSDKLIVYAILMSLIVATHAFLYIIYVFYKYKNEISFSRPKVSGIKSVTGFAGWTVLDVLGSIATRQGYAIILNRFFGTIINAAFAISRQIEGHIFTISASVIDTMKPQIMKSYGAGNLKRMFRLSMTAGKFGFSMMSIIAIPLIVMMPSVLNLWLVEVPEYTVNISRIIVFASLGEQITRGLVHACQATGNIKKFSLYVSIARISALPLSVLMLILGQPLMTVFYVFLACELLGSALRIVIMHSISSFEYKDFFKSVIYKIFIPFFLASLVCVLIYNYKDNIYWIIINGVVTACVYISFFYLFGLTSEEKKDIVKILKKRTLKKTDYDE